MAYDFHYTPTGTGVISGKEVLEQTEDAINDLGNTAISGVQEALDKAEQALTNSENAVDDAQTALNTANNAEGVAIQAQNDVSNLSGTVTNIGNRVTTAEGNISNLQGRMTTAEGNIGNLQGRMTTAEGNIGNLQTAVSTAQATANSAQQTATTARQQSYVFRYSSTAITDNSTIAYSTLDNTDNIKVSDKVIDTDGKIFSIASVDSANQTVTVGSALIDLALDGNVVHKSGDETVGGIKSFSGDTFIKSLNFTNEVPSPSSSNSSVMPIITTITYSDSSPSVQARLNLRVTADGIKSFYPHENNQYSLGLTSRRWTDFFSYHGNFAGQQQGNEYSGNAWTNLTLLANRDSVGQSGCVVDTFRENTSQGTGSHILGFGIKENSVRYEGCRFSWLWDNDLNGYVFSFRPTLQGTNQAVEHSLGTSTGKWDKINGVEPSSLGMPDTSNALDISGYITDLTGSVNTYTALANGYVSIRITGTAMRIAVSNGVESSSQRSSTGAVACYVPVVAGETVSVYAVGTGINNAIFRPCKGNV